MEAEGFLDRVFQLRALGTDLRTEVIAGLTTFMVMAYIIFVNPSILSTPTPPDRLPISAVTTSTALVAGIMTIAMGLATNRAYAIAPGMGLNAVVAFQLMGAMGLTAAEAMGVIVAEGLIITILVLLGIRRYVMTAIPLELKQAISVGIGLFILFIGLVNGGIVVPDPATLVRMGDLRGVPVFVTVVGLLMTMFLLSRNVRGALLWGILGATVVAIIARAVTGTEAFPPGVAQLPSQWVAAPDFSRVGDFSFGFFAKLGLLTGILVVLSIMMADFFDTMGTLIGVGRQAGYLDERGELPQAQRALLVDSLAAVAGGAASASSATTYIESAAGVGVGGRSGLVSVVVGILFLLSMPFWPVVGSGPAQATAPALIIGGWMNLGRDKSLIKTSSMRFDLTSQVDNRNQVKAGFQLVYNDLNIKSYTENPGMSTWNRTQTYHRFPYRIGAYLQDKLEFQGFIANIGVRLDYTNPNGIRYDLQPYDKLFREGYGNTIEKAAPVKDAKAHLYLSPRLGVSHPITDNSKLYFNYGHFLQEAASTYRFRLQREANGLVTSIGNPDLEEERTVAYELGYSQNLFDMFLLNIAAYYRDITNQPGWVYYQNVTGSVKYNITENNNYQDVRGFEVTLTKRAGG